MKKYVAFLDILGFKDKLKKLSQEEAQSFIGNFSTTAYNEWQKIAPQYLHGYIVSDSFIIYTQDVSKSSLTQILTAVEKICQREFVENGILIRGAIAKGEFDKLEAREISTLSKGLIVGQAYVEAYLLESSIKTAGIALTEEVFQDIEAYSCSIDSFRENVNGKDVFVMRYFNFEFLNKPENLIKFTKLAIDAKWIPHYYNTFYWALKKEESNKANSLINNIVACINNGSSGENWRELDAFIKGVFHEHVNANFQTRFLTFLRERIVSQDNLYNSDFLSDRKTSEQRVLQYIIAHKRVSTSQIAANTGLSSSAVRKITDSLLNEGKISFVGSGRTKMYFDASFDLFT